MTALIVASAGPLTSVQDAGRFGAQRYGLTTGGAMDRFALACANVLVGNSAATAAIEIGPFPAAFLAQDSDIRIAVAGAGRDLRIGERMLPMMQTAIVSAGERLSIGPARDGVFSILGIEGGIGGAPIYGSLSVTARLGIGSPFPRPLQAGDELSVQTASARGEQRLDLAPRTAAPIRVVMGPQDEEFTAEALRLLFESEWRVSSASDRMGYRLEGPRLVHTKGHNIVSDGTVNGSIQVPGNGQPIVLLADRGTTGGYPKIATVIGPDLGPLAQRRAGEIVTFVAIDIVQAQLEARRYAQMIDGLAARLRPVADARASLDALMDANLAGDAVNATDITTWQTSLSRKD
jgi:biotin-dependent carboxylase-like uncharacterized protein